MMSNTVANPSGLAGRVARAAALGLLALAATLLPAREARAQWTQPDAQGNINNTNPGNVGVGTTAPQSSLHVSTSSTSTGSRGIINEQTSNDVNGALLIVRKSRAGGAIQNGDAIGNLYASAFDGTGWTSGSRMRFIVDGPVAAGSVPTGMEFLTGTGASALTRMRITSGGNIGVNITVPTATFHLFGGAGVNGGAAPTAFNVTGGPGGNSGSVGGAGGDLQLQGGAGGWNTAGSSLHYSGPGGAVSLLGGTGGQHLFGVNSAGAGGPVSITGGTGGAHNVSGYTGGVGGNVVLNGGAGGTGTNAGAPGNIILANQRGNVGIGTATPSFRLDVLGGASRNTLSLAGDGDTVGFAGIRIAALTTTGIAANRSSTFNLHMRKDAWYGGDGSGPSFIIETGSKTGGFAAPFMIAPNNDIILNSGTGVSNMPVGRVGIGTAAPGFKLDVQGGQMNASGGICIAGDCKTAWSQVGGNSQWTTSGTNIFYNSGNVGMGTATPAHKLDVTGNVNASSGLCIAGDCKTAWSQIGATQWTTSGSNIHYNSGSVGVGTATPGARLDVGAGATARGGHSDVLIGAGGNNAQLEFYGPTKSSAITHDETAGMIFYTNGPSFMPSVVIGNGGNVGIGTTTPLAKLDLTFNGAAEHGLRIHDTRPAGAEFGGHILFNGNSNGAGAPARFGQVGGLKENGTAGDVAGFLGFYTNSGAGANSVVERMRISSAGNVGVGTAAPAHRLDVAGNVNASTGLCIAGVCKGDWSQVGGTSQWTTAGPGIHYNSGNVGIGTTNPGQKLGVQGMIGLYPQAWTLPSGRGMFMLHGGASGSIYAYNYNTGTPDPISISADSLDFNTYVGGNSQQRMFISNTGNVGIGTGAPSRKLHVFGGNVMHQWSATANQEYGFYTAINNNHFSSNLYYDGQWRMLGNGRGSTVVAAPQSNAALLVLADNNPRLPGSISTLNTLMHVTMDGKVGVNTSTPATALHVVGDVTVTGNIAAKFQDVAEWVPSTQELKAGTVVVLDAERSNHVLASSQAYDTRVAGVVSAQPGVILGEAGAGKLMVATTGRVKVRVDATRGPIKIGDLLVTSDVEGVAMKSQPVSLGGRQFHSPGTLIGKALEPLASGVGEILVLLSLQ